MGLIYELCWSCINNNPDNDYGELRSFKMHWSTMTEPKPGSSYESHGMVSIIGSEALT
jgi:hypothetical protein